MVTIVSNVIASDNTCPAVVFPAFLLLTLLNVVRSVSD